MATPHAEATPPLTAEQAFDSVGPAYEAAFQGMGEQEASLKWLLANLPPAPARIVDIGCGTGRPVVSTLAAAGHDVLGIDISGVMIKAARERVPDAIFRQMDVRKFLATSTPASFDAITVYFSLIASVTQVEIRAFIGQFYELLRPGGLFVFATVPIAAESLPLRWMGRQVVVSGLAEDEALDRIKSVGFSVESQTITKFMPKGAETGICQPQDVWEETHLFVHARKHGDD